MRPKAVRYTCPSEKDEQRAITALFRAVGATVYSMSQYRASHVAIGLPDLYVMHLRSGQAWWFEVKRYEALWRENNEVIAYNLLDPATWRRKLLSGPQAAFGEQCAACLIWHFWGGRQEAQEALLQLGLAERAGNGGLLLRPYGNRSVTSAGNTA